ncbi:choline dehydrogenase-like flavoprotein [Arthrobacter stackebrandtii]|uniref:Choline dehydrogenase-like flavoprotein n=1 Tax=Arthrobacter stackebrandtii TaxID=272161 RepID=A0ABS4YTY8_9MICC|nr:GMC oxidoreductase [Arthrobacter stackebrandtii]MBP2411935.1 choline dehydrogenase-like flavoprotein [Arthrobacter stackebrandtii]
MNHVFFLSEGGWKAAREEEQFDHIIIGTGFCSYAFAERTLSANPFAKILIIERGPFFLPQHFQNLPLPYKQTLGGLSETFPWTLAAATANQPAGNISWQHGMVPFFGGRSIMWSAWCPRPLESEMRGWPAPVIEAAQKHFESAEKLLNVISADQVDAGQPAEALKIIAETRPVYGTMQRRLQTMMAKGLGRITSATRSMPAPLAAATGVASGVDFAKFSTPAVLLELANKQDALWKAGKGNQLRIVTDCTVERVLEQDGKATALQTSRGVVKVGEANVVLAMGTLPPATLVQNSFPQVPNAGEQFSAHFITSVVARVPRKDFDFAQELGDLELAAIYLAGESPAHMQYHVQLSVLSDRNPVENAQKSERYAPDVVSTASMAQLLSSEDYLVFVCAVLGELDEDNAQNHFRANGGADPTTNVTLQVLANSTDEETWNTMDEGTFQMMERVLSPGGAARVEYWHGDPNTGSWGAERPSIAERRVPGLVHESSSLPIGDGAQASVGLDYGLIGVDNVYVTGGGLWPTGGSWNPTMTMVALAQDLADKLADSGDAGSAS